MISDQVWLALILAMSTMAASTVAPIVVLRINRRSDMAMKKQEAALAAEVRQQAWDRLDAVAAAAAAAAADASAAATAAAAGNSRATAAAIETARLLVLNTEAVTDAGHAAHQEFVVLHKGQDAIHTLVNSHLTTQMRQTLISLKEIVELKKALGQQVSVEALAEIVKLQAEIDERERATVAADALVQSNVVDTRVAAATEKVAAATEKMADAIEKVAPGAASPAS